MNKTEYCYICGVECFGNLKMQIRKNGDPQSFCPICFDECLMLDNKRINKKCKMKENRKYPYRRGRKLK